MEEMGHERNREWVTRHKRNIFDQADIEAISKYGRHILYNCIILMGEGGERGVPGSG